MKTITPYISILILLCAVADLCAQSVPAATSSSPVAGGSPIPLTLATVSAFTPDKTLDIQIGSGKPTRYRIAKSPVYVGPNGSAIDPSAIKPGAKVSVHFMTDGNETIIDRVFVQ